jgi:hypothetical protein
MPTQVTNLNAIVQAQQSKTVDLNAAIFDQTSTQLGQEFNLNQIDTIVEPETHPIFNAFDDYGLLLGLKRLPEERNSEYKQRLLDVFVHPGSASYKGIINTVNRELGTKFTDAITIDVVRDANGVPLAANPLIEIKDGYIYLYSGWAKTNPTIELKKSLLNRNGSYTLTSLVSAINGTTNFTASLATGVNGWKLSGTLFNQSSAITVRSEDLELTKVIKLINKDLLKNTITFNDSFTFANEVASANLVLKAGDFYIDYTKGAIETFVVPSVRAAIRYQWNKFPMIVQSSDIIAFNLPIASIREQLFQQNIDRLGSTHDSELPTSLGTDIINELYSVSSYYLG